MYQQTGLLLFKLRFLFAGIFAFAILTLSSALITALGSNTILDARAHPTVSSTSTAVSDSPNTITVGISTLMEDSRLALISAGRAIYKTCQAITSASAQAGKAMVHGSAVIASSVWQGIASVGQGIGKGVMFTLRLPGKALGSVTHARPVHTFMRPANDTQAPAVIDSKTSEEQLAQYNEQQRQKIASLLAAQLTANENLGGLITSGDPNHGGYPSKWANARQDSLLDDWGLYNRECVSYAAWKVHQTYGHMPHWGGVGNANQWVNNAKAAGVQVESTPKVHSVAISMEGYYGHAMWVEAVKGNMVYVSQYNYDLRGRYSEMWVNATGLTYLYFK